MPDSSHAVHNNSAHVHCPTNNRFIVHAGDTVHTVVCPDPYYTVEVYDDAGALSAPPPVCTFVVQ